MKVKNPCPPLGAIHLTTLGPLLAALLAGSVGADETKPAYDLSREPVLYLVAYAHLDTEWRWEYPQVIQEYLAKTLLDNFALIEKYPHYIFNFSGAYRYQMMKEYYPRNYEKLKAYVAAGRWFPAGSSVDENDVNAPAAESVIRQVLYGNDFFRRELGVASAEYMLPDCFGFPASLPSILAHCGVKGFSTQKLSAMWQPSPRVGGPDSPEQTPAGIPFNVGIWEGPDGKTILAALNPGAYGGSVTSDLSKSPAISAATNAPAGRGEGFGMFGPRGGEDWPKRLGLNGQVSGIFADYHYYGTGDTGGSPTENSVQIIEAMETRGMVVLPAGGGRGGRGGMMGGGPNEPTAANATPVQVGDGPVRVVSSKADQMFRDILKANPDLSRFPRYKGDLELINHSAGSLTSQAYHKRWNRQKELLADAAEKASLAAMWLGGKPYPRERLNQAWMLCLAGQMHDIIPGTATPKAYEYAWNDDAIVLNQFAGVLGSAVETVASGLDTQAKGTALVVYNPLNVAREDVVEATLEMPAGTTSVRVTGPDGKEVPAQYAAGKVLFVAQAPPVGFAVFEVGAGDSSAPTSELKATETSLENARYRLQLDTNGDVASVFDKGLKRELLAAPIRLAIKTDSPRQWPAWNMDYDQQTNAPRSLVSGPAKVRVVENGLARVALEIERETEGSKFVQIVRLAAGDAGNRVEFANRINWKSTNCNLKATFPLTASNLVATYNWDVGTLERPTNHERQFEVASHQWIDLTDADGTFGATVLTDCKLGSDKPDDRTLRLTLIRTPGARGGYPDQASQDWGHHEFVFGLAGHAGDWRHAQTDWQGHRLNQPLLAFESARHPGSLGKTFSFLNVSASRVRVLALKKAEHSEEVVIRLVELDGRSQPDVRIAFAAPIIAAREVDGQEQPVGGATVSDGRLVTAFAPYQPRTFALKLAAVPAPIAATKWRPVTLDYDRAVTSSHGKETAQGFDDAGRSLPGEMLPAELAYHGIGFRLGPVLEAQPNAVVARGQTLSLPAGQFSRVYVLAASAQGDQRATFRVGDEAMELTIQDWSGYIGQWDNRLWSIREEPAVGGGRRGGRGGGPGGMGGGPGDMGGGPGGMGGGPGGGGQGSKRTTTEYSGLAPGYMKLSPIAWYASHHHLADGSAVPYAYAYLFAYALDVPSGASTLTLPNNNRIRVLAVTVAEEGGKATPVQPLYDTLVRAAGNASPSAAQPPTDPTR